MRVKVCGMRENENIQELIKLDIDFIGFNFYPESKRFIGKELDSKLISQIPKRISKVGVFVNQDNEFIIENINKNKLDFIQLHGNEKVDKIKVLHQLGCRIIKAIGIKGKIDFDLFKEYEEFVEYFLLDNHSINYGGTGNKFNWNLLKKYNLNTPLILGGGISSEDFDLIKQLQINKLMAVDINSCFEIKEGVKNIKMINEFVINIKL